MRRVRSAWLQRRLWLVAGVAVAVALVGGTWWLLIKETRGAEIATVLALTVAVLSLIVAVGTFAVTRPVAGEGKRLLSAARGLAGEVRKQEENVLVQLLGTMGDPAKVEFSQPELVYWRTDGGDRQGSLAQIESYYRELQRGRLIVLGKAGSGKTVLAITLIRNLAAAIMATPPSQERSEGLIVVPVRLSLPAFDPAPSGENLDEVSAERVVEQLEQWLAGHLVTVYGVASTTAKALVTQGWILPVLDGLDEMDPPGVKPARAAAVLRALNHHTTVGLRPVVLTCRTERYEQLTGHPPDDASATTGTKADPSTRAVSAGDESLVVEYATVVKIQPLTAPNVLAYLIDRFPNPANSTRCQPRWHPVTDRLAKDQPGDPLVAALRSPLRLFLTVTSYRHKNSEPGELTTLATTAQFDEHLFPRLIPAVLKQEQHQHAGQKYTTPKVTRWLTTLAHHLARQAEQGSSPSDLQLDLLWPAAGRCAPRYAAMATTTMAASALAAFGVLARWPPHLQPVLGVVTLIVTAAWIARRPTVDLRRLTFSVLRTSAGRQRVGQLVALGLAAGLVSGFIVAPVSSGIEPADRLMVMLKFSAIGLVGALMIELNSGPATRPTAIDRPSQLVQQGMIHTVASMVAVSLFLVLIDQLATGGLLAGIVGEIVAGLEALLAFWLAFGTTAGFAVALGLGLNSGPQVGLPFAVVALIVGLLFVANSPWPRYLFATLLLTRRGDLPKRPAAFIDWAYQAGLMRLSGIAVQFRHREFQTWLTTRDSANDPQ